MQGVELDKIWQFRALICSWGQAGLYSYETNGLEATPVILGSYGVEDILWLLQSEFEASLGYLDPGSKQNKTKHELGLSSATVEQSFNSVQGNLDSIFVCFETVCLCSPGWPRAHSVDQVGL